MSPITAFVQRMCGVLLTVERSTIAKYYVGQTIHRYIDEVLFMHAGPVDRSWFPRRACAKKIDYMNKKVKLKLRHFRRFFKSEFTALLQPQGQSELPGVVRFVSTNKYGFVLFRNCGESFIYSKKNDDPKMEPCGTPQVINRSDVKGFCICRFCFQFVR